MGSIGGGSFWKEDYFESLGDGGTESGDFVFEAHRVFAICIEAATEAGDGAQKGVVAHFHGSDEDEFFQACQSEDISVGGMVCHQQVRAVTVFIQDFRVFQGERNVQGSTEFLGTAAHVSRQRAAAFDGIAVDEGKQPGLNKEIRHQPEITQKKDQLHGGGSAVSGFTDTVVLEFRDIQQGKKIYALEAPIQGGGAAYFGSGFEV